MMKQLGEVRVWCIPEHHARAGVRRTQTQACHACVRAQENDEDDHAGEVPPLSSVDDEG